MPSPSQASRPVRPNSTPSTTQSLPQSGQDYSGVSNPYANSYINQTWWDRFVNRLGFRSSYDEAEALRQQNYATWESQQQELVRQEQYNSPEEQAERQREAGLNPDLNGQVDSGQSAEPMSANYADMAPAFAKGREDFGKFMSGISNAMQLGLSLATGIPDLKGKMISNSLSELGILEKMPSIAETLFDLGISSGIDMESFDFSKGKIPGSPDSPYSILASSIYDKIPKRYRRAFSDYLALYATSSKGVTRQAKSKAEEAEAITEANDVLPEYVTKKANTELLNPTSEIVSLLTDVQLKTLKAEARLQQELYESMKTDNFKKYSAQYEADKESFHAQRAQALAAQFQAGNSKIIFGALNELFTTLKEQVDQGGIKGFLSSGVLSALGAVVSGMVPSVSFSGSVSEKGASVSHSFGF